MIDPRELETGKTYTTSKQTPLMPELKPRDVFKAIKKVVQLDAGMAFNVVGSGSNGLVIWYQVTSGEHKGWINSTALIGQELAEV